LSHWCLGLRYGALQILYGSTNNSALALETWLTSTISARKATIMGKQHNKVEKRRRRKEYLRRKKSAAKSATKR